MSESTLPGQDSNQESTPQRVDPKELDLPETVYVRDIENRVFQGIVLQCLAKINGVSLLEGNLIDNILGRGSLEGIKGIHAEQDEKNHSIFSSSRSKYLFTEYLFLKKQMKFRVVL